MAKIGQVVARRMIPDMPNHVAHIKELQWQTSDVGLKWSTREDMVRRVESSQQGTFFTEVNGHHAALYAVHGKYNNWVQTEPDETKIDNLLHLPLG